MRLWSSKRQHILMLSLTAYYCTNCGFRNFKVALKCHLLSCSWIHELQVLITVKIIQRYFGHGSAANTSNLLQLTDLVNSTFIIATLNLSDSGTSITTWRSNWLLVLQFMLNIVSCIRHHCSFRKEVLLMRPLLAFISCHHQLLTIVTFSVGSDHLCCSSVNAVLELLLIYFQEVLCMWCYLLVQSNLTGTSLVTCSNSLPFPKLLLRNRFFVNLAWDLLR